MAAAGEIFVRCLRFGSGCYDDAALDAAENWLRFTASDVDTARMAVATDGLQAKMAGRSV